MTSLLDVGPLTDTIDIRGTKVTLRGIGAEGVFHLLHKFPQVRDLMMGKGEALSVEAIMGLAPDAIACVIAAGAGLPGDEKAEQIARSLGLAEQTEAVRKIFKMTFPKGAADFKRHLDEMTEEFGGAASGWDQGTRSLAPSKNASETATLQQ